MKDKRIARIIASVMTGVMILSNYNPAAISAADNVYNGVVSGNSDDAVDLVDNTNTDTTWQNDFEYQIIENKTDDFPAKTIVLKTYNGKETKYKIPAKAIINGEEYKVGIFNEPNSNNQKHIYMNDVTDLSFEEGVIAPRNCRFLFENNEYEKVDLTGLDTSNVTNMRGLFYEMQSLKELNFGDIDTGNVTEMSDMLRMTSLDEVDISMLDTKNVESMCGMLFWSSVSRVNMAGISTEKLLSTDSMFFGCAWLKEVDMSGVDLSNVSHVNEMFWDTDINVIYTPLNVLKDIDLSGEYFDAITGEDYKSLPQKKDETIKLLRKGIYDKPTPVPVPEDDLKWPTPKSDWYTDYDYLLEGNNIYLNSSKGTLPETVVIPATAVIDGVTYNVVLNSTDPNYSLWYPDVENIKKIRLCKGVGVKDGNAKNLFFCLNNTEVIDISEFDTSTITDMSGMFGYCMKVQDLDLSKFDTSNVTDMNSMFCGCHCLRSLDLSSFNTSRVTDMGNMFTSCATLTSLNISSFDTSNVTRMNVMFGSCQKLKKIDVSSFDTSKVTCMNYMFSECDELTSLDLRNFDTTNVTGMLSMFFSDQKLVNLDISGFNTSNVTDMDSMFAFCKGLRNIDISGFDTSKVTVMQGMFRECTGLTKLDVSGFDTSNVTNLGYMFYGCTGLRSIDVSNFNTSKVTYMSYMFKGCSNLVSLDIRKFIIDEKCKTSEMLFNSGSIRMLPVEWIKGYNHKTIGGNKNDSILKKIYYAGTKEQWETLENVVSDDVEILFEQTGEIIIPVDPIPVTGITIEQGKNYRLVIGEKVTLIALYTPDDATQYTEVTWESDNENVATVDPQSGTVTAVAIGKVKITATTANNKTASCIIKIYDPNVAEELSAMNSAVLIDENTSEIHLVKGQKFTLPETGWDCSDKKILKISKKGVLTAKKDKITPVKLTKGEQSIDVYVSKPSYLSKSITLDAGKTQDIGFSYDKDNLPVAWYSNAPDVATISENGEVKAVAKGTATITAYVNGAAYTCKVKVKEPDATLERTLHLALKTSKSIKISGVKKLVWTADDPSLVEIKGSKIKGLATGETILRAKNGDKEYVIHLYVEDATIITEGIIASGKNKYSVVLQAGENIPIGFKYVDQDVVFKSNNGEVAYFDEGVIVANKSGKAKLNAKVNGKSVVLSVLVK